MNSILPYSEESYSRAEKDKMFNNFVMFVISLSELYCMNEQEWFFKYDFVANSGKVKFSDELYLFYKDQGYTTDDNDIPYYDIYEFDLDYNEYDFDFECDDSDNSDYI